MEVDRAAGSLACCGTPGRDVARWRHPGGPAMERHRPADLGGRSAAAWQHLDHGRAVVPGARAGHQGRQARGEDGLVGGQEEPVGGIAHCGEHVVEGLLRYGRHGRGRRRDQRQVVHGVEHGLAVGAPQRLHHLSRSKRQHGAVGQVVGSVEGHHRGAGGEELAPQTRGALTGQHRRLEGEAARALYGELDAELGAGQRGGPVQPVGEAGESGLGTRGAGGQRGTDEDREHKLQRVLRHLLGQQHPGDPLPVAIRRRHGSTPSSPRARSSR